MVCVCVCVVCEYVYKCVYMRWHVCIEWIEIEKSVLMVCWRECVCVCVCTYGGSRPCGSSSSFSQVSMSTAYFSTMEKTL